MKTLFTILSFFIAGSIALAQTQPSVTISTTGNRNKQVIVDGKSYTIDNATVTDQQDVVIDNLVIGQHTLEVVRLNQNTNRNTSTKTTFMLRDGYDLAITVGSNGTVSTVEKRMTRNWNNGNNGNNSGQLSVNAYNKLYNQVKIKTTSSARSTYLESELNNLNKTISSKQASDLIQLINSESLRLKLAKLAYVHVKDTENYSLVVNLLSSTYNRTDLNNYIATLPTDDEDTDVADINAPLTDTKFQEVYTEVNNETIGERSYYLNNFFSRDFNFYTSAQTKQLIELVPNEQERLTMAKNAYRGVTDRENYGTIYQLLSNPSSRSQLVTYINSYDQSNPRTAMGTVAFDKLYQSVYIQNSPTARFNTINNAFAASGNYFTVAQAKKLIGLISTESNRLQLTKNSYKILTDRANYTQFNDLLSSSTSRNDLKNYVSNYDNLYIGNGVAMSETDYNTLYKKVNAAWSAGSRFTLEADAFRNTNNYFTTYQVRQLLLLITSESDRLNLAKNAYDNVVDPDNFNQLYSLFNSTANRNDLTSYVSNMQNGTDATVRIPMSESEFSTTVRNVQLTFGIGAKFSSLSTIFNTSTNYFTVAQAKQLIGMVSSESNRLDLAKASYDNITDPANFNQIYDLLSSPASKNELMTYVGASAHN